MDYKNLPIGVFDSGIGGLTVLECLNQMFPNEDFIYVADKGNCPYGTKSEEEIKECVINVGTYLINQGVKAIVIACNTASLFTEYLQNMTDIPIISVIEPTCFTAIKSTKTKKVAVLATNATINNGAYQNILEEHNVHTFPVSCSEFVELVEQNHSEEEKQKIVNEKLSQLKESKIDIVIHGCTHFGLLEPYMKDVLGDVTYISCGHPTSEKLYSILNSLDLIRVDNQNRYIKIYTTGKKKELLKNIDWFKVKHEPIQEIKL